MMNTTTFTSNIGALFAISLQFRSRPYAADVRDGFTTMSDTSGDNRLPAGHTMSKRSDHAGPHTGPHTSLAVYLATHAPDFRNQNKRGGY